jgi:hypothetical protein
MSTSFITPGHIRAFQAVTRGSAPRAPGHSWIRQSRCKPFGPDDLLAAPSRFIERQRQLRH